jgi:diguanylate cyclase (GGDEF)-like protein
MLDPIATALVVLLVCIVFAGALQALGRRDPTAQWRAYRYWSFGLIAGPTGWVLVEVASWLSQPSLRVIGLTLVVAGAAAIYRSILAFRRRHARRWHFIVPVALAFGATSVTQLLAPHTSVGMAVVCITAAALALCGAREGVAEARQMRSPHGVTLAATLTVAVLALVLQALVAAANGSSPLLVAVSTPTGRSIMLALATLSPAAATLGFVLMGSDRLIRHAQRIAARDGLTGLYNRRTFMEGANRMIAHAHRSGEPLAMLIVDVDHFKPVNDTHGHQVGDLAMVEIASALASQMREEDLIGRIGGEEFAVMLPELSGASAILVAERLRLEVRKIRFCVNDISVPLTVSVGVTELTELSEDLSQLMRRADRAMYSAKELGRDRVECMPPSMRMGPKAKLAVLSPGQA